MQHPTQHENARAGRLRAPAPADERGVDVPLHEVVDGFVPRAPVRAHARAVPPLGVKFAVAEAEDLGQGVEGGLEDGEEAGEPDDEADGGEFHEAFEDGGEVEGGHFEEGVVEEWCGVFSMIFRVSGVLV